jgi:hypothetical protein
MTCDGGEAVSLQQAIAIACLWQRAYHKSYHGFKIFYYRALSNLQGTRRPLLKPSQSLCFRPYRLSANERTPKMSL